MNTEKLERKITPPFFELGPKAYLFGKEIVDLAIYADQLGQVYDVRIIITPQYVDISDVVRNTSSIHVFAQHMDYIEIGRGYGSVLPEAIKAVGATGVFLNHIEKRLSMDTLKRTIRRAEEVGLMTMVCADNVSDARIISKLKPTIVVAEEPEKIGGGSRNNSELKQIKIIDETVKSISPDTLILHGAGIREPKDVYEVISAGAQGTGSTSAVILADNRKLMLKRMIQAVHRAWIENQYKRKDAL